MNITSQDIIDKEFRVKFRGFDMAEVDTFLEEVAEVFFKLTEENTQLREKILALQNKIKFMAKTPPQAQIELPAELGNSLDELKQDTAAISAELVALKQDRSTFASLEKSINEAVASLQKAATITPPQGKMEIPAELGKSLDELKQDTAAINTELAALKEDRQTFGSFQNSLEDAIASLTKAESEMAPQGQTELPADLRITLEEIQKGSTAINAELAALKEDRQTFDSLKNSLEEIVSSAGKAGPAMAPPQAESGDLAKTLEEFRQGTETMGAELAAFKQEIGSIQQIPEEIKGELETLLKSHFDDLDTKISEAASAAVSTGPPQAAAVKEQLLAAIIEEEPEGQAEESRLPDFEVQDDTFGDDDALEFLSEDDILDVDKLRDVFQSVLDDSISDSPESREDDETSADLLFLEDFDIQDEPEPEVTFSIKDEKADTKPEDAGKA
jgi:cell division initiation protein